MGPRRARTISEADARSMPSCLGVTLKPPGGGLDVPRPPTPHTAAPFHDASLTLTAAALPLGSEPLPQAPEPF